MYYLQTLPINLTPYGSLAESASLGMLAPIQGVYPPSTPTSPDTQVQLLRSDYLTPAGTLALLPFTTPSGSYPAHGRAVFFSNDSSRLYVVAQADSTSNLANGWGVEVFDIGSTATCGVTLASSSLSIASSGGYASVAVTATPDCIYAATTNQPWISLASGAYGSGKGTLQWIVRPNAQLQSRGGTITINGQTFTIQQSAAPLALPNPAPLSFNVVDSDYSTTLDRIVAVAASPNELHIYDPSGQTDTVVSLRLTPTCVSVAPDGLHAAVGHDGCVIVPYELAGQPTANVSVSFNGSVSAQFTQPVAPTAPHFFTKSYQAAGQIAALNSDYSVNSSTNPAPAGSVVVLYGTGEGVTSPPGIDGSIVGSNLTQPLANVTVTIGGQPANVLYAGGSPGLIEGLLQINVRIPAGTPAGNAPVTLVIGTGTAPSGATIAVGP